MSEARASVHVGVPIPATDVAAFAKRLGGELAGPSRVVGRVVPPEHASAGDLAPLFRAAKIDDACAAASRGATILVSADLAARFAARAPADTAGVWRHPHAVWAMAEILDGSTTPDTKVTLGEGTRVGEHVVFGPRVVVGKNVVIGHGAVIGSPGFGWTSSPDGAVRAVPQLGGVVIEDDVHIGALTTIDAGTLGPTRIRRGAKLDAHVHVGHNGDIGEGCIVAAQVGFAGSVTLGRGVLVGGQAGFADHVTVGDFAKIAGGSGVIGDVPPGGVVAGYPAVPRARWLRSWAWLFARSGERSSRK